MILAFHQPNFLPNLAFFYKMSLADIFVITTNLQFEKSEGWQRRHKIKAAHGDHWLTVPVLGSQNQLIKNVAICNTIDWQRKHIHALRYTYSRTPEPQLLQQVLELYQKPWERLVDLNMACIRMLREALHLSTPLVLDEEVSGRKYELISNVCRKYEANIYLSGRGGKQYMTPEYHAALASQGVACRFVERDLGSPYPYTALHYVLSLGSPAVRDIVCA